MEGQSPNKQLTAIAVQIPISYMQSDTCSGLLTIPDTWPTHRDGCLQSRGNGSVGRLVGPRRRIPGRRLTAVPAVPPQRDNYRQMWLSDAAQFTLPPTGALHRDKLNLYIADRGKLNFYSANLTDDETQAVHRHKLSFYSANLTDAERRAVYRHYSNGSTTGWREKRAGFLGELVYITGMFRRASGRPRLVTRQRQAIRGYTSRRSVSVVQNTSAHHIKWPSAPH